MIKDEVEALEKENQRLREVLSVKDKKIYDLNCSIIELNRRVLSYTPVKIFTHKKRGNTTLMFADRSSITVKKKKGEKYCLDTAIAYAYMKHCINRPLLKTIIEEREEH